MISSPKLHHCLLVGLLAVMVERPSAVGQIKPWDAFSDPISGSVCDVVNASNAELVVLKTTGAMVLVTGSDVTLHDLVVDVDGFVSFEGEPAGQINFATDGDGLRTMWYTTLTGRVMEIDDLTGEPTSTAKVPTDFADAACDACEFWDDPAACPAANPPIINVCGVDVPLVVGTGLIGLVSLRWTSTGRRRAVTAR
ncbi:MAG: hypothetical protein AABZ12_14745 [Planctomycetota bacterium]